MDDQDKRNHKASLRYTNSLNTEMHSTGVLKKSRATGKIQKISNAQNPNVNSDEIIYGSVRQKTWTDFHPPPL